MPLALEYHLKMTKVEYVIVCNGNELEICVQGWEAQMFFSSGDDAYVQGGQVWDKNWLIWLNLAIGYASLPQDFV